MSLAPRCFLNAALLRWRAVAHHYYYHRFPRTRLPTADHSLCIDFDAFTRVPFTEMILPGTVRGARDTVRVLSRGTRHDETRQRRCGAIHRISNNGRAPASLRDYADRSDRSLAHAAGRRPLTTTRPRSVFERFGELRRRRTCNSNKKIWQHGNHCILRMYRC